MLRIKNTERPVTGPFGVYALQYFAGFSCKYLFGGFVGTHST